MSKNVKCKDASKHRIFSCLLIDVEKNVILKPTYTYISHSTLKTKMLQNKAENSENQSGRTKTEKQ